MRRILFLWATRKDRTLLKTLETHLGPVAREHGLELQHESGLRLGDNAMTALEFINRAVVIVPLISPELIEEQSKELSRALMRRNRDEALLLPVLARDTVRPSAHSRGIFSLVIVPQGDPIARWPNIDHACALVAEEVDKALSHKLSKIQMPEDLSPQYENESIQALGEALNKTSRQLEILQEREEHLLVEYRELQKKMRQEGRLMAGDILSHRFRLLRPAYMDEQISSWDSWDLKSERTVMVHELSQLMMSNGDLRARALSRIEQVAAIEHPALLGVVSPHEQDMNHEYFVTEPLERPLGTVGFSRRFSANAVISLALLLGEALSALHSVGLVHGAVRPTNILCAEDGQHKLGGPDILLGAGARGQESSGIEVWGSAYAAPEFLGRGARHSDVRTDVYGLAMSLAALLYGADLGRRRRDEIPTLVDGIDCGIRIRNVLREAISTDPLGRHDSIEALCAALVAARRIHASNSTVGPQHRSEGVLEMVAIPGAELEMGGGEDARPHELPPRRVQVTDFEIGKYPVTTAQYAEIMALPVAPKSGRPRWPVTQVSVHDAVEFCNRLSSLEGLPPAYDLQSGEIRWLPDSGGYRLPLEAEWELAARGTDGRRYAWGNEAPAWQLCWDGERPATEGRQSRLMNNQRSPESVDLHPEGGSPYGVQDMQGNVWEWCWDWFESYKPVDGVPVDPSGPDSPEHPPQVGLPGAYRVLRGGSWRVSHPSRVRAAARSFDDEVARDLDIGFRVARGSKPAGRTTPPIPPAAQSS